MTLPLFVLLIGWGSKAPSLSDIGDPTGGSWKDSAERNAIHDNR